MKSLVLGMYVLFTSDKENKEKQNQVAKILKSQPLEMHCHYFFTLVPLIPCDLSQSDSDSIIWFIPIN